MKNLFLLMALSFSITALAQDDAKMYLNHFNKDKSEYLNNACIINSVSLWFTRTCKDIAWEAGNILASKGYVFSSSRVDLILDQPMKSHLAAAKITSVADPRLSEQIDPKQLVGKIVAHNTLDIKNAKYLVLSQVDQNLDLQTIESVRIGKQGVTNDFFCHNSVIMARKYLDSLRKIEPCRNN